MNFHLIINHYGYWGVLFILFTEMVGIPFPAETTLTISGFEWSNGVFKLIPLVLSAAAGNIIGSTLTYWIGRLLGRPVILKFGKYVGITRRRLDHAERSFRRSKEGIVLVGKFIAGVRVLIPYLAGINKMKFALFTLFNTVSAFLWVILFVVLGKYISVEWTKYHTILHRYIVPGIIVMALLLGAIVARKVRKHRPEQYEEGTDDK